MNNLRKSFTVNLTNSWNINSFTSKRLLFSPSVLGLNTFLAEKERKLKIYQEEDINTYKKRIKENLEYKDSMVFTNDVMKLLYLVNDKDDVNLVHQLLKKLKSQRLLKVESFNFGTHIMRLHHIMNMPKEAKNLVENPMLYSDFSSNISFVIFLDMLFKNNLYEDVIQMFNYRLNRSHFSYSNLLNIYYFAACYKLNTNDAFNKATSLWQDLQNIGFKPGVRIKHFLSALSINQNEYFCAMEVLPLNINSALSDNFKAIIYAKTKRFKDTHDKLNEILNSEEVNSYVLSETLDIIGNEIHASNEENIVEFNNIKQSLINKEKVRNMSIDETLCHDYNYMSKGSPVHYQQQNKIIEV